MIAIWASVVVFYLASIFGGFYLCHRFYLFDISDKWYAAPILCVWMSSMFLPPMVLSIMEKAGVGL